MDSLKLAQMSIKLHEMIDSFQKEHNVHTTVLMGSLLSIIMFKHSEDYDHAVRASKFTPQVSKLSQ